MDDFLTVAGWIISGLYLLIGWVFKMIFGRIKEQETQITDLENILSAHKLHVAETYTTKADIKDLKDNIISHLVRIEDKLDKKADKP